MAGRGPDPVEVTASAAAPDAALSALRRCPVGRQPSGRWAVTDRAAVAAVLTSDAVAVAPPGPVATEVDRVRATMARFSDGEAHARRRAIALDAIAGLDDPDRPGDATVSARTTRRTAAELTLDGVTVPAGDTIVVALGAATRASADGTMSFGAGVHACPGRDLALAIAAGMLTALGRRGALVTRPGTYEPRPNLRVPVLGPAKLTAHRVATAGADQ